MGVDGLVVAASSSVERERRGTGMGMKGGKRVNRQTKASLSAGGVMGGMGLLGGGPRWLALTPDTLVGSRRGDGRERAGNHEYIEWRSGESAFSLHDGRSDSNIWSCSPFGIDRIA